MDGRVGGGKTLSEVRELRGSVFDGLLPGYESHQGWWAYVGGVGEEVGGEGWGEDVGTELGPGEW